MRKALLSAVRQMTSSRQSPKMSRAEAGGRFGAVVGDAADGGEDGDEGLPHPVPAHDAIAVEEVAQQAAVPPDGEVGGAGGLADFLPFAIAQAAAAAPHFFAGVARVDVGAQAAADVHADQVFPENLTGLGIVEGDAGRHVLGGVAGAFVDAENLQPGPARVERADVQSVAVTQAGGEAAVAVGIDDHGVVNDFVLAVAVDVGHADGMSPHAAVGGIALVGIEDPARGELAVAPIPGGEDGSAIVASAHDDAGADAVEISDAGEEAVGAVADGIVAAVAADAAPVR